MKLSNLFDEKHILFHYGGEGFAEAIRALIEVMRPDVEDGALDSVAEGVLRREGEHPSVPTPSVCLAHLRDSRVLTFRIGLIVPEEPIVHPAVPDSSLEMIFLILAPQDQNTLMLQTLATLTRLVSLKPFTSGVRGVRSASRLIRQIEESGVEVKRTLCAADIMEPIEGSVGLDTGLPDAISILHRAPDEGVPVLDEKGQLVGELTTREVLVLGMPKYMDLLSNPEMLNAFEPFENYFKRESEVRVRDICRRDFPTVAPNEPIVGVAHRMITQNRRRIYVLQDGKVEGVIYRKNIMTRIMGR
jgi:mannitol/fructose-specific phosphotransferase system IIA component (Ntr-type)